MKASQPPRVGKGVRSRSISRLIVLGAVSLVAFQVSISSQSQSAHDPGVRSGDAGAGGPLPGLTAGQNEYFVAGKAEFAEAEDVADGMGPRMNLDSCGGCHSQPAVGGTSPAVNPQVAFATLGRDTVPSFLSQNGPVREARFVKNGDGTPDGGVHALFTISGRAGAQGCSLKQDDFETQVANHNVIFRIPTPAFGTGLIEQIPDAAILANVSADAGVKGSLGIK
ncbi:MAG TPA: hypothetical protein VF456_03905, partial [Vicinamibacterales bacterium]